ncbi:MAG: hypothetical protein K1X94_23255 [Sandaracinaceae bacterium]|nr:hypothetical protein [Sandaracinaceae bacterium]
MSRARHSSRGVAVALALGALSVGGAACGPFSSDYLWSDDFEGPLCEGAPCGWTRLAGAPESARWSQSLPGEHGLTLEGNGVIVSNDLGLTLALSTFDSSLALDLIARCDLDSSLTVEIGATEDVTGAPLGYSPTRLRVLTSWTEGRPNAAAFPSSASSLRSLDTLTIAKSGDGVCEVDFIGFIDNSFRGF